MSLSSKLQIPGRGGQQQQPVQGYGSGSAQIGDPQQFPAQGQTITWNVSPAWQQFVWAPYAGRNAFKWGPYLRSIWLEFLGSVMFAWLVSTMASVATSGSVGLNALTVAVPYAAVIFFFYSWRQTAFLPRHLNPALTMAELAHRHVGLVVALPYWVAQIGGSALTAVFLNATGGSAIPNYLAAARPVSYWGAMAIDMTFGFLFVYTYVQNMSILDHLNDTSERHDEMSKKYRGSRTTAGLCAGAGLIGVCVGFPNGVYALGNMVPYFGPAINLGFGVPESAAWTIPILWGFLGGIVAWALHLLTWNVNGLVKVEYDKYMSASMKESAEEEMALNQAMQWVQSAMHQA